MCDSETPDDHVDQPITLIATRDTSIETASDELQALVDAAQSHPDVQVGKKNQLFATLTGPKSVVLPFAKSFERALNFEEDKALNAITPPGPFDGDRVQSHGQDDALQFDESEDINEL